MIGEASVEGRPGLMRGRIGLQPLARAQRLALAVGGVQ
jgi:hypothetical protein